MWGWYNATCIPICLKNEKVYQKAPKKITRLFDTNLALQLFTTEPCVSKGLIMGIVVLNRRIAFYLLIVIVLMFVC